MLFSKITKSLFVLCITVILAFSSALPAFAVEENIDDSSEIQEEQNYLATPVLKAPENTEKGIEITWEKVQEAKAYKIFVKKNNKWEELGTSVKTSFVDTEVNSGKSYTYTVCCVDESGEVQTSLFDNKGVSIKYMAVPQITGFDNVAKGTEIKWTKVNGATKYYIYRKVNGEWKYLGSSKTTKYLHKISKNNSSYIYSIRSEDKTGAYRSGYATTGASNTFLSAPVLTKISNTQNGVTVYWKKVAGAVNYKVFVKTEKNWKAIGTTKSNNFTHKNVVSGKKYTYIVRCVSKDGNINKSYFESPGISTVYLSVPKGVWFKNVADGTQISWKKVDGANCYKLYIKNGETWKYIGSTNKTEYNHKINTKNTLYTYRILATNTNNNHSSAVNKAGYSNRFIAPVTISSVTYNNDSYTIKWNKISNVSKYRVYRKTPTSAWVKLGDVKSPQYTDKAVKQTGTYMYMVRCLDENSRLISGYLPNNKFYHKGQLAVNRIMGNAKTGYYYVGPDGIRCNSEEIQLAVDFVVKYSTGNTPEEKFRSAFKYMKNYPYKRFYDHPQKASDLPPLAVDFFRNKKGNCFREAAATACLARVCGFRAKVVTGDILGWSGYYTPHGWNEVYYNGKWRICDMNGQAAHYMLEKHVRTIKPQKRYELTVSKGKAIWK